MASYHDQRKAQKEHVEAVRAELKAGTKTPMLYRHDLFGRVKSVRWGSNVSQLGVREIAGDTGLSVKSVTDALAGNALKLDTLYRLARYFGVPWQALFDVDFYFVWIVKDDGTGIECNGITSNSALGSKAGGK